MPVYSRAQLYDKIGDWKFARVHSTQLDLGIRAADSRYPWASAPAQRTVQDPQGDDPAGEKHDAREEGAADQRDTNPTTEQERTAFDIRFGPYRDVGGSLARGALQLPKGVWVFLEITSSGRQRLREWQVLKTFAKRGSDMLEPLDVILAHWFAESVKNTDDDWQAIVGEGGSDELPRGFDTKEYWLDFLRNQDSKPFERLTTLSVRSKKHGEPQVQRLALAMPYVAAVRLLFGARIVETPHTRLSLLRAALYLPAPRQLSDTLTSIAQRATAHASSSGGLVRVQYPCCNAMQVPIEIYRVVTRVAKAGPFSGRDFFVEKGTLAEQERTHPGEVFPGLPFMISAIPAKAVLGVTGSSTATRSDASCVDPTDLDWTPWHAHYLQYMVTPLPEEIFYRTRPESQTLAQEFMEPVANACPWEIPALEFRSAAPAVVSVEVPRAKRPAAPAEVRAGAWRAQMRQRTQAP
jgi:hypothetical protein